MFKLNNKDTRTTLITLFWTYFTLSLSVYIVDFGQAIICLKSVNTCSKLEIKKDEWIDCAVECVVSIQKCTDDKQKLDIACGH